MQQAAPVYGDMDEVLQYADRVRKLPPAEFALQLYGSTLGKGIAKNPVDTIARYIEDDGKTLDDEITRAGRGFPHPFRFLRRAPQLVGVGRIEPEFPSTRRRLA